MIFLYQARVIPLQLQKLFAKLLLLDQDSISTTDLTDSFGWAGNEVCMISLTVNTCVSGFVFQLFAKHINEVLFVVTKFCTKNVQFSFFQGFQQHDVQELNRILFSALESSLIGTPGAALIRKLYHGTSVTKVHKGFIKELLWFSVEG